jgi:hypothetical protein
MKHSQFNLTVTFETKVDTKINTDKSLFAKDRGIETAETQLVDTFIMNI